MSYYCYSFSQASILSHHYFKDRLEHIYEDLHCVVWHCAYLKAQRKRSDSSVDSSAIPYLQWLARGNSDFWCCYSCRCFWTCWRLSKRVSAARTGGTWSRTGPRISLAFAPCSSWSCQVGCGHRLSDWQRFEDLTKMVAMAFWAAFDGVDWDWSNLYSLSSKWSSDWECLSQGLIRRRLLMLWALLALVRFGLGQGLEWVPVWQSCGG